MRKVKNGLITFFLCFVGFQVALMLVQPYLALIGKTLAISLAIVLVVAVVVGGYYGIRFLVNKFDKDDNAFNG
ncbi:hypothetical protein [Mycolicibacterium neoaurum]|uniref:hypothetical protein n=1 Tax=Mycolicibacterium neoaurum TaxID=1795 RepID=UPI001F4D0F4B|nr:hypothetical protein [Mycolicibacterium neoaurum]